MIMKALTVLVFVLVLVGLMGCGEEASVQPPPAVEDWTFPANASKFAVALYSTNSSVAVNGTSDIRVVMYNVSNVFGASIRISIPQDSLLVTDIIQGPVFGSASDALVVSQNEPTLKRASFGITLKAGSTAAFSGSEVLCKFKVQGKVAGPVSQILPWNTFFSRYSEP
jgi:hypothetical protein